MPQTATTCRTLSNVIHDADFGCASAAVGLQAKNIKHSGLYFVRAVQSALDFDGKWKPGAKDEQRRAIAELNGVVRQINAEHREKNKEIEKERKAIREANREIRRLNRLAKQALPRGAAFEGLPEIKPPALKKIYREFGAKRNPAKPSAVLDIVLLDRAVRQHRDPEGFCVYEAVPAVVAQQVLREVIEAFRGYIEASKLYRKESEKFTGKPGWPDYGDKHLPVPFTFTAQSLARKEKQKVVDYRFVSLDGKKIHLDYEKRACLAPRVAKALADFPLGETLAAMRKRAGLSDQAKLCEVRVIPLPNDEAELEAVFEVPMELPPDSLAAKLYKRLDPKLKPSQVNAALVNLLRDTPFDELPRIVGLDPGLNNFLTLAYSFRQRAMVLSNRAIEKRLEWFDRRYDRLKSELTSPQLSDLLVRNLRHDLDKTEIGMMRKLLKALHADAGIRRLLRDRANWRDDMVHKVSAGVVKYLVKFGVQVLVIGLNPFWKQGSDMGRKQNRRSYRAAHTKLVELLKYKCLEAGILVVTTEESYTSKTSFALNEELQVYDSTQDLAEAFETDEEDAATGQAQTPVSGDEPTAGDPPPAAPGRKVVLRGRRGQGNRRHFFECPGAPEGWAEMHADVNGAFNIIRKVFSRFRYDAWLTPKFLIFKFSQTANLIRMRLTA